MSENGNWRRCDISGWRYSDDDSDQGSWRYSDTSVGGWRHSDDDGDTCHWYSDNSSWRAPF